MRITHCSIAKPERNKNDGETTVKEAGGAFGRREGGGGGGGPSLLAIVSRLVQVVLSLGGFCME